MMFDIKTEEIEIKGEKYRIRPLSGRYLPKFYAVLSAFEKNKESENVLDTFNEEITGNLQELALETFKASYPQEDVEKLDMFVSQNLLLILEGLIKVNVSSMGEQK